MINTKDAMCTRAIREHIKSFPVKDFVRANKIAKEMINFMDENNGSFAGKHAFGFGIHHVQLCNDDEVPLDMFVVDKKLLKEYKSEDSHKENFTFPARVIYNPEIVTMLPTVLVDQESKEAKIAKDNVFSYPEACLSFPYRKERNVERFGVIKVRYQTVGILGRVKMHEEWIEGLKSHIFQHEVDHANGIDIHFGDGERRFYDIPIEERYRENYRTQGEIEKDLEEKEHAFLQLIRDHSEYAIIEDLHEGNPYRIGMNETIPDGYVEGSLNYYSEDGYIKSEYREVPVVKGDTAYGASK